MKPKTEQELRELAIDIYESKVFTSHHVYQRGEHVSTVFMPIGLGALANMSEEEVKSIGLVYEYMSEAGPGSTNGMPVFFSCRMISRSDAEKVFEYMKEYAAIRENFTKDDKKEQT